jgi:integrase
MNRVSDFMLQLSKQLVDEKKIAESSASLYIKNLWTLNGCEPYKNLAFLRKTAEIDEKLKGYADSTRKTFLASIVSVLSLVKDKATYKKVYDHYHEQMMTASNAVRTAETSGEKSDKQKENWIEWEDVMKKRSTLADTAHTISEMKNITASQYNELLTLVVLSLYTDIPPRRNQDYSDMYVVGKWNDKMDANKNYLDLLGNQMVFNKYKTAKKYGTQFVAVPSDLHTAISMLLKHHPLHKGKITKNTEFRFLAYHDGQPLTAVNAITRILNKVFGKKVGSSMLRHSYLSSKYADVKEEQQKDADAMGHSVGEQQGVYVKK